MKECLNQRFCSRLAVLAVAMSVPVGAAGQRSSGLQTELGPMYVRAFSGHGIGLQARIDVAAPWTVGGAVPVVGWHGSVGTVRSPSVHGAWLRLHMEGLHVSFEWDALGSTLRPQVTLLGELATAGWGSSVYQPICHVTPAFPECVPRRDRGVAGGVAVGADLAVLQGLSARLRVTRKWNNLHLPNNGAMATVFAGVAYHWAAIP